VVKWSRAMRSLPLLLASATLARLLISIRSDYYYDKAVPAQVLALESLKLTRDTINNQTAQFCYPAHSGTKQAFISKKWKSFSGDSRNNLVYPFCLMVNELGNRLGNYFTEVGCAEQAGLNFIAVHPQFDLHGSHHGVHNHSSLNIDKLAFLNALPEIIVHPNATFDEGLAIKQIQQECHCTRYCWQDKGAAWVKSIPSIQKYMRQAITSYFLKSKITSTTINNDTDITNAKEGQVLPIVPDVAIQYRCGDNIGFSYMYGILVSSLPSSFMIDFSSIVIALTCLVSLCYPL
jgi:hypothetical protein